MDITEIEYIRSGEMRRLIVANDYGLLIEVMGPDTPDMRVTAYPINGPRADITAEAIRHAEIHTMGAMPWTTNTLGRYARHLSSLTLATVVVEIVRECGEQPF